MNRSSDRKIVVVSRAPRLEGLKRRFNTIGQAKFMVESQGGDFSDYITESTHYTDATSLSVRTLETLAIVQQVDRTFLPNYVFGPEDVVVCLGQDGLVANTLKYLHGQPVIGVNPDPTRFDGVLLPFCVEDLSQLLPRVLAGDYVSREVTMAELQTNDGRTLFAVNDFFIGQRTHVSARYQIQVGGRTEVHSSSGIIVSTGLGSTGWFKSLITGAMGIADSFRGVGVGGGPDPIPWNTDQLVFTVREPFPSRVTGTGLVFGMINASQPLQVTSQMAENGVIFSDGIENDFLEFNSGSVATIFPSQRRGKLVAAA